MRSILSTPSWPESEHVLATVESIVSFLVIGVISCSGGGEGGSLSEHEQHASKTPMKQITING